MRFRWTVLLGLSQRPALAAKRAPAHQPTNDPCQTTFKDFPKSYLLETRESGQEKIVCSHLEDAVVKFVALQSDVSETWLQELAKSGIRNPQKSQEVVYPQDGIKFLKLLPQHFNGSYLRAAAVTEF